MSVTSIVIAGVGGQGTLLASKILGQCALDQGRSVKVSEVHGMAQRGGSVITYVRYGSSVASPLIEAGQADVLLAFEELECLRRLPLLRSGGLAIMNEQKMLPMPVITGACGYPEDIPAIIRSKGIELLSCDALAAAAGLGSPRSVNVVLIGMLAARSEFPKEAFAGAITKTVKPRFLDVNLRAFELGFSLAGQLRRG